MKRHHDMLLLLFCVSLVVNVLLIAGVVQVIDRVLG